MQVPALLASLLTTPLSPLSLPSLLLSLWGPSVYFPEVPAVLRITHNVLLCFSTVSACVVLQASIRNVGLRENHAHTGGGIRGEQRDENEVNCREYRGGVHSPTVAPCG
jgi:hypothetical protein